MTVEQRQRVVDIAQSWIGTPFHDVAGIKGVGVDCAHLLARVYEEAALIEHIEIEPYSPHWFLHRDEELFLETLKRFAHEIDESSVQMGDCLLYKVGRCYAHGAIVVDWPRHIIHAHKASGRVIASGADNADMCGRERKFFSILGS